MVHYGLCCQFSWNYTWFYQCPPVLVGFDPFPCLPQIWNHALAIVQCLARRRRSVQQKNNGPQRRTVGFHPVAVSEMSDGLVDDEQEIYIYIYIRRPRPTQGGARKGRRGIALLLLLSKPLKRARNAHSQWPGASGSSSQQPVATSQ